MVITKIPGGWDLHPSTQKNSKMQRQVLPVSFEQQVAAHPSSSGIQMMKVPLWSMFTLNIKFGRLNPKFNHLGFRLLDCTYAYAAFADITAAKRSAAGKSG